MKKILLYLSLLAFAATALGCSPQAKWNREQKKAMHDALQAYRQMAYLQDLTDPEFVVFSDAHSDFDGFLKAVANDFECVQREPMGDFHFNELVPKGCSKATGIDFLVDHLGASLDDCYVFGDSANDLPMLTHVKNSIAMGNGEEAIKACCSYVTKDIEEDGIYEAMKHFGLIKE